MKKHLSLLTALLLTAAMLLSSCSLASVGTGGAEGTSDSAESAGGSTVNNEITITPSASHTAYAAAMGLRSAVSIYCTYTRTVGGGYPWNPTPTTQSFYTMGSGVIYRLDGGDAYIITNYHLVYNSSATANEGMAENIYVYLYGLEKENYAIPATFVGGSPNYDIAVLRVEDSEVLAMQAASGTAAAVTVGEEASLYPGMATLAIGNPSTESVGGISVTQGIVSVDSETITMSAVDSGAETEFRVIRTDTPVNPGNSGGGLFNDRGEWIGIVNAKLTVDDVENIGYAIPVDVAQAVADNILRNCDGEESVRVKRPLLGIGIQTTALSSWYDPESGLIQKRETVSIVEVSETAPAFRVGDVILSLKVGEDFAEITRQHQLLDLMLEGDAGETVIFTVLRDGETVEVSAVLTEEHFVEC